MNGRNQAFSNDPVVENSLRHSIKDGVYFSFMTGGAESYFLAFAIFLHASTSTIGLLASLPPLLASSMQAVSAWLGRRFGHRKRIIVIGAWIQAFCLLPLAALPLYAPDDTGLLLISIVILYFCGPNLGAPQWTSLIGDLLPEARRGRFFATRTRYSSLASLGALALAGVTLNTFDLVDYTYWGFVSVFLISAIARCMSAYHLQAMHEPPARVVRFEPASIINLWRRIRHSDLIKFSVFFAAMQFAVAISGPYFTLYMLRDLGLSYFEFMTLTVASVVIQFLTLNRWGRLSDLFGNRLILITTGTIITLIPSMWLFSTNYFWLLTVQAISGLCWAGFTLSTTAFVYDLTPAEHRVGLFATHSILAAVGVFLGASLGAFLVQYVPTSISAFDFEVSVATPLLGLFLVSCFARILVAAVFLPTIQEVRRVRQMSMGGLIFRVTRMHPISGLIYDIVGRVLPSTPPAKNDKVLDQEEEENKDQDPPTR
ncbi:MAG: MFS transporter [Proteobacteria bacterium]|nr:MFS transporter [Pseudomonadota bacterium]